MRNPGSGNAIIQLGSPVGRVVIGGQPEMGRKKGTRRPKAFSFARTIRAFASAAAPEENRRVGEAPRGASGPAGAVPFGLPGAGRLRYSARHPVGWLGCRQAPRITPGMSSLPPRQEITRVGLRPGAGATGRRRSVSCRWSMRSCAGSRGPIFKGKGPTTRSRPPRWCTRPTCSSWIAAV